MEKGHILLLNGVSSAGKTTLTKVLQQKLTIPYYHICCDDFMNMSPPQMLRMDGGFPYDLVVNTYEQTLEDCADTIIAIRRAGQKLML